MGMDLYAEDFHGIDGWPPASEYFRANVWSWGPIRAAVSEALASGGYPDLSAEETEALSFNDGLLISRRRSLEFAEALERWVDLPAHEGMRFVTLHQSLAGLLRKVDPRGKPKKHKIGIGEDAVEVMAYPLCATQEGFNSLAVYTTDLNHLEEFMLFCRTSGGFRVS